jgi:arylformamidase
LKRWMKHREDTKKIEAAAPGVTIKLDVAYLNDKDPFHTLDVYFPPKKEKPLTVLIHIHGGGWEIGDKKMMRNTGLFYASQGVIFVTPNYRLSPKVQHPAHVEDCAAALAWVFDHAAEWGGDTNRIFLSGHSAGAQLSALLGTSPAYLQKFNIKPTQLAGVIPVDTASFNFLAGECEKLVQKFVKESFGTDERVLKEASPFYNVTNKGSYPRFLIFNTTNRKSAAKGGKEFADKLKSAGCDARFVPVNNHTHSEMATGMFDPSDPVGSGILKFILHETDK